MGGNEAGSDRPVENHYLTRITKLSPPAIELLDKYSHIPEAEMLPHAHQLRDKAWKVCPYGCIGLFGFTVPSIQDHPSYSELKVRAKEGHKLLDLGCGFGQNMRKLVLDGAPPESIFGADLSQDLIDCGYDYFRDGASAKLTFFVGDILEEASPAYKHAEGQFDMIWTAMFFHLWNYSNQLRASIAVVKLLRPVAGSVLVGCQLGATPAVEISRNLVAQRAEHSTMFRHDATSFTKMWEEVGRETGTKWKVDANNVQPEWMKNGDGLSTSDSRPDIITFTVTRL